MLLLIAAYLTALTLAPVMLGLGQVATFPLTYVATRSRVKLLDVLDELLEGFIGGFGALWLATVVFDWLAQTPHWSLPILYAAAALPYYLSRIHKSATSYQDVAEMIGAGLGLAAGAVLLFPEIQSWALTLVASPPGF
jgi:hypothetical protein